MNKKPIICSLFLTVIWIASSLVARAQLGDSPQVEVKLKLIDELGKPVAGANTIISFIGVVPNTGKTYSSVSGSDGTVKAKALLKGHVKVKVTKEGYYPVVWPHVINKGLWGGGDSFESKIILREIKKPIGLYAKKVDLAIPEFDKWIGFDLQKGDWTVPHGRGEVKDIEFFTERNFDGFRMAEERFRIPVNADVPEKELRLTYGKWTGELKMRVPTEGGGIHTEKKGYQAFALVSLSSHYSQYKNWEMRLPHLAPEEGYQAAPIVWKKSYPYPSPPNIDPKVGYFLKTRMKLDSVGEVISANYAKIMTSNARFNGSDIHFDPRGKISFSYYFNPTANDRNLEFAPKKNLFHHLEDEEEIRLP